MDSYTGWRLFNEEIAEGDTPTEKEKLQDIFFFVFT